MKRLAMIASTSVLALCLTACGEHAKTDKETTTTTTTTEVTQPVDTAPKADAAPAANEAQVEGATTQE